VTTPAPASRFVFPGLLLLAVGLSIYVIWPFRAPLFLAAVLASVMLNLYQWLTLRLGGRERTAATVLTIGLGLSIVGPIAWLVASATQQIVKGMGLLRAQLGLQSMADLRVSALPPRWQDLVAATLTRLHLSRDRLMQYAARIEEYVEHAGQRLLESSSRALFHTAILLIAFYFFLIEADRLTRWLWRVSPLEEQQTQSLLDEWRNVSRATIVGTGITALFQALVATLGYLIAGVPRAVFFGLLTLLASFIPVVGTLLVWVPVVVFLALFGHGGSAIFLSVWCGVLVVGAEHVGKPFVLRAVLSGHGEMHTGLLFLGLLGGIEMFGIIGIILGPLVIAFLVALLQIYERDFSRRRPPTIS
jgi:predicted PurR-regulated permease PerM